MGLALREEELVPIRLGAAITENCQTSLGWWDPTWLNSC